MKQSLPEILEEFNEGIEHMRCPSVSGGNIDDFVFNENDIEQFKQFLTQKITQIVDEMVGEKKNEQADFNTLQEIKKKKDWQGKKSILKFWRFRVGENWGYNQKVQQLQEYKKKLLEKRKCIYDGDHTCNHPIKK